MNLDDLTIFKGKVRHRDEGAVAHDEHVTARQFEKTLNIGDVFAAAISLPRQTAAQAELAPKPNRDNRPNIVALNENLPPSFVADCRSDNVVVLLLRRLGRALCHL
jgi:hypothetical protein